MEGMMGAQSRSYPHGVPKVSTFTHHNKLTSRIVNKPLIGLTTLNQALICTPTPSLMGVVVMNIEWDYGYYQPWSDNKWLVDEIIALIDKNIIMQ